MSVAGNVSDCGHGEKLGDLLICIGTRNRVALLHQAGQLLVMAFGFEQFVIGQLAPHDLGGTYLLLPFAFQSVDTTRGLLLLMLLFLLLLQDCGGG